MQKESRSKLFLVLSMTVFGTIGIFRRYIPLTSGLLAFARGALGMLCLLIFVFVSGKKLSLKAIRSALPVLCISGGLIGFNWILLFESYRFTTVATATLCYYMAPVFVILVSPLIFKEKLTIKKLLCVAAALLGMVFVSGVLSTGFSGTGEFMGVVLGLGAAILYATVVVLNKKTVGVPAFDKTIIQLGSAAAVVLPYTLLAEDLSSVTVTPIAVFMLILVGVLHTGISYALYFGSMDHLKAQTVALFSYIDPVVAIILSAVLLKENISVFGIIGAVLILGSTLISELDIKRGKK